MKRFLIGTVVSSIIVLNACKSKKEEPPKEAYFPVLSYIRGQLADIDTSLYTIRKIIIIDSLHSDTVVISREAVRDLAKDFLSIPDISDKKFSTAYKEEKIYDESMNSVILSYKPVDPDKEEIQLQEVLIRPDPGLKDKVSSIIIDRFIVNKDSSVQKRMLWQVDHSFQVATIVQKAGQPETAFTLKVIWNEMEEQ